MRKIRVVLQAPSGFVTAENLGPAQHATYPLNFYLQ